MLVGPAITDVTAEGVARLVGGSTNPAGGPLLYAGPLICLVGVLVLVFSLWLDRSRVRRTLATESNTLPEVRSLFHIPMTSAGIIGMAVAATVFISGVTLWSLA